MRELKTIEHSSLDGVIQHPADGGEFPYGVWTAPYRTPARLQPGRAGTAVALSLALALACADRQGPSDLPRDDLTQALDALDRKVCLTIGDRTNGPRDRCEPQEIGIAHVRTAI